MRRIAAAVIVSGLSCVTLSAASAGPWHFGARAGWGMTNIHGDFAELADPKYQSSATAGVFAELDLTPSFSMGLEALYVSKGFKVEGQSTDPSSGNPTGTTSAHLRLKYLEVPIIARVPLPVFESLRPYVLAGPTAGIALSARSEIDGGPEADLSDDLQSPDWGALAGLGTRFSVGSLSAGVEARYSTSFDDLWDISNNLESINHGYSLTMSLGR